MVTIINDSFVVSNGYISQAYPDFYNGSGFFK
jgi:hypothetical protein